MRAILMAAGVGSRISKKITGPKCTLEIETPQGTKPLIRHTIEKLLNRGFHVTIIVGYMHSYIEKALNGLDVEYCVNPFFRVTNSMASLWFAQKFLDGSEDVVLMNADVFWTDTVMDSLIKSDKPLTMLGDVSRADVGDYFFGTENGHIIRYGKELQRNERDTEYVGMALIKKDMVMKFKDRLNTMVDEGKYDLWWENVLYEYCSVDPVSVVDVDGNFWAEVDYFEDYVRIVEFTHNV